MKKSKLRVFEAFSGIGAQRKALENLGIDHEVVAISEIDNYATKDLMVPVEQFVEEF